MDRNFIDWYHISAGRDLHSKHATYIGMCRITYSHGVAFIFAELIFSLPANHVDLVSGSLQEQ